MTLEELRNHVLYLKERDNSSITPEKFKMELEFILKCIDQIEHRTIN